MRYFLSLIALFFLFCSPVFSENKLISYNQKEQYQTEINQLIDKQIPITKNLINKVENSIINENNIYVRQVIIEQSINSILFNFYMELINVTDKYTNIKENIPATDYYVVLKDLLTPYLNESNINIKKIDKLLKYAEKKQAKLEKKYINIFANNKHITLPQEVPQHIVDFTNLHTKNKQYNQNIMLYHVGKWNEFNVYGYYFESCKGKYCGLPMYILDNGKYIRYASGCERDEIMSNGKVKCKNTYDNRIKSYEYYNKIPKKEKQSD